MLQQITNSRQNKQLTKMDLKRITYASHLNLFHGNTMYDPYPFGIYPVIFFIYIKRIDSNCYLYQNYRVNSHTNYSNQSLQMSAYFNPEETITSTTLQEISADLICNNDGEERVLIWSFYCHHTSHSNYDKSKLGLFILPLKSGTWSTPSAASTIVRSYFECKLVITPKPGLFPVAN
ncbi:MAG: hypothetical protein IJT36_05430 [Alphaproteobacteria bacterium]|nr:hypothetical protein [Alphaproteobacteria bacterium]